MNRSLTILVFAMLAASAFNTRGDESRGKRQGRDNSEKNKDEWKKLSPEQREAKAKEGRKTNGVSSRSESEKRREQWKNMTPEQRAAKRNEIKERLEKRIAELHLMETTTALSAQEVRELERCERILKRFEQEAAQSPRIERPKAVFTNAPKAN